MKLYQCLQLSLFFNLNYLIHVFFFLPKLLISINRIIQHISLFLNHFFSSFQQLPPSSFRLKFHSKNGITHFRQFHFQSLIILPINLNEYSYIDVSPFLTYWFVSSIQNFVFEIHCTLKLLILKHFINFLFCLIIVLLLVEFNHVISKLLILVTFFIASFFDYHSFLVVVHVSSIL